MGPSWASLVRGIPVQIMPQRLRWVLELGLTGLGDLGPSHRSEDQAGLELGLPGMGDPCTGRRPVYGFFIYYL